MGFAAAVIAGMAVMVGAVVDDGEVRGGESIIEKLSHFLGKRSGHDFHL